MKEDRRTGGGMERRGTRRREGVGGEGQGGGYQCSAVALPAACQLGHVLL